MAVEGSLKANSRYAGPRPLVPRHHGIVEPVVREPLVAIDACVPQQLPLVRRATPAGTEPMTFEEPRTRSLRYMNRFDALELHACVEHEDYDGEKFVEQHDDDDSALASLLSP